MPVIKNEIPILEYDNSKHAVIDPDTSNDWTRLPEKAVIAFLGDMVDDFAAEHGFSLVNTFETVVKDINVYVGEYNGEKVCLMQTLTGAPEATALLDALSFYGVRKVIATGSCGVLDELPENAFIIPKKALRDEGTSYGYLPPSRFVGVSPAALAAIEKTFAEMSLPYVECTTWTTDCFFRETADMVKYRREEGCSVVEMECAGMCACAQFRGIDFGEILFTADTLADTSLYDARDFGRGSRGKALLLALDVLKNF